MDRSGISLMFRKEIVWATWYSGGIDMEAFYKAVYMAALTDGSDSIDEIFRRIKQKYKSNNSYDPSCYEVLDIVDVCICIDLDTRNIYVGGGLQRESWPVLDISRASAIANSEDFYSDMEWLYKKRLPFDEIDNKELTVQAFEEYEGRQAP